MTTVERYLFRQMAVPVLGALAALTAVALLSESLTGLEVIVERGQSAATLITITLLALPQLLSMVLPVALFVGALIALNRLQTEQEVVVCYAAGMSRWQVISPAIRLAVLFVIVGLILNVWVQPLAQRALRAEYFRVRTDLAATLVREGEFVQAGKGLTVYVQSVDQNGLLRNPFIYVQKQGGSQAYAAQQGRIVKHGDRPSLVLRHGSSEEFSDNGVLDFLSFDEYVFDLSPFVTNDEVFRYKASDRFMHELLWPNMTLSWERKNREKMLAEAHSRLATPLYSLSFMALALAGVLGGPFNRLGYGKRIAQVAAAAAVARIVGFGVQAGAASEAWVNIFQYLVPLVPLWFASRTLFRQKIRRYVPRSSDQGSLIPSGAVPGAAS